MARPAELPAPRPCPVCGQGSAKAQLFAQETIDPARLTRFSFASRKEPEYMSHRLVRCADCDLVYADLPPAEDELAQAYHDAGYDSADDADDAAAAYLRAIAPVLAKLEHRDSALEIGAGTGVFLEHLERAGFSRLAGVEPSRSAIEAAPARRQAWIRQAMFDERDYAAESFDLVCCFMTMEHVRDPGAIARSAWRLLRPGGAFVTVTHDHRSLVNRVLGRRSPIIDIEHMQLFSPRSTRFLFEHCNYREVQVTTFVNVYALRYWLRLLPLPARPKRLAGAALSALGLGRLKLPCNVGNMLTAGWKPA